ncbi:hypothetical protein EZV62_008151 [Acer yangbiense]|uniref:Uncharacterized protein n=1 Tax=Acer yangbiense TaxID=1000413 RepID=A0A5C7IEM8_9ROSI|nr:hypothetical protein EZV62_008151 [Acer yangbiense]
MHVDVNSLSGHLPDSFYSFSYLQQFSLSENYFSGQLNKELRRLTSLKYLIIFGNRFSGEFPNVFGNLTNLEFFIAHSNSFSGPLPLSLGLCSKLHVLDLRNNFLSGSIDLNFIGFPSLYMLDLAGNRFFGSLPNSLAVCHQLKILSLAENDFTGQVPESFAKTIPPAVGQWKQLHVLDLSRNNISGTIPAPFQRYMVPGVFPGGKFKTVGKDGKHVLNFPHGKTSGTMYDTRVQFHHDELHFLAVNETQLAIYDAMKVECLNELVYASFLNGAIQIFTALNIQLQCQINSSAYLQPVMNSPPMYLIVVAEYPLIPNQFAVELTDGGVYIFEPLESNGQWGLPPPL